MWQSRSLTILNLVVLVGSSQRLSADPDQQQSVILLKFALHSVPSYAEPYLLLARYQSDFGVRVAMKPKLQRFSVPAGRYYVKRIANRYYNYYPRSLDAREPESVEETILVPPDCVVY